MIVPYHFQVEHLQSSMHSGARYRNSWEGLTAIARDQGRRRLFARYQGLKIVAHLGLNLILIEIVKGEQPSQTRSQGYIVSCT